MIIVMGVMAASSLFVAAAFAAANGDLPLTRDSQDRKQAYAAAEAGINLYQFHLNQDPDYWTRCTNVPAPNGTENQPVNQIWDGVRDPRRWRNVAGRPTQYTIELLPAPGKATCAQGDISTMLNPATGTFRIRSTGRPREGKPSQAQHRRQLPAQVLPRLPLLHRLRDDRPDQLRDHLAGRGPNQLRQRALPASARHQRWAGRRRLRGDPVRRRRRDLGPVPHERQHPDLRHAGVRARWQGGLARVHPAVPGLYDSAGTPAPRGHRRSTPRPASTSQSSRCRRPTARWRPSPRPTASSSPARRRSASTERHDGHQRSDDGVTSTRRCPDNGVIYVKTGTGGCGTKPPSDADYAEPPACGNLYVSGTYNKSMTFAAANDIIVRPTGRAPTTAT